MTTMTEVRATRAANDRAAFAAVKVGDIFVASWGYDQTNIDFYEVVAKTAARVKVRPISSIEVEDEGSRFSTALLPAKGVFTGPAETKAVRSSSWRENFDPEKDAYIKIEDYTTASKWNGGTRHATGLHYGH